MYTFSSFNFNNSNSKLCQNKFMNTLYFDLRDSQRSNYKLEVKGFTTRKIT